MEGLGERSLVTLKNWRQISKNENYNTHRMLLKVHLNIETCQKKIKKTRADKVKAVATQNQAVARAKEGVLPKAEAPPNQVAKSNNLLK
jgi:hypothetical protein